MLQLYQDQSDRSDKNFEKQHEERVIIRTEKIASQTKQRISKTQLTSILQNSKNKRKQFFIFHILLITLWQIWVSGTESAKIYTQPKWKLKQTFSTILQTSNLTTSKNMTTHEMNISSITLSQSSSSGQSNTEIMNWTLLKISE